MWNRDLNKAGKGHVDFPRLYEAGVKLQCFTIVTRGFPFVGGFPLFAARYGWGRTALKGEWAAANWQIDQMNADVAAMAGDEDFHACSLSEGESLKYNQCPWNALS